MWVYRSEQYSPDELMHYGILGMRWGVRRTPEELGHEILKNEHKQAENAAKIAKMEKKHQDHPNQAYRKSEARLYKRAKKLADEHENLLIDKDVAEKHQKALQAKAALKEQQRAAKEAKRAQKEAIRAQKEAQKEMERREKANSHNLQNKPLAEMTDKELADYLTRKANEAKYMQYNPKPRTVLDEAKDFVGKNIGKVAQAGVDVGLDVGKQLVKQKLIDEFEASKEKPNSWQKYKDYMDPNKIRGLSDYDAKKAVDRIKLDADYKKNYDKIFSSGNKSNSNSNSNNEPINPDQRSMIEAIIDEYMEEKNN